MKLTPLAVIACENAIGATDILAGHVKDEKNTPEHRLDDHHERARYANSAIDRIVPAQDPNAGLNVKLERFYEWVIDGTPFKDHEPPAIKGVKWVDDLVPYIERKLFTVNTGHAAAAYWGYNMKKSHGLRSSSRSEDSMRRYTGRSPRQRSSLWESMALLKRSNRSTWKNHHTYL